jgi:cytochrome c oxidase assembly protein subunit 15
LASSADRWHRRFLALATLLVFFVLGLGAYVRLSDAGLGCPDWPGCYGHLVGVPDTAGEHAAAAAAFPGKPVDPGRAWKEMIHRYAAGTLGLLILGIAATAWKRRGPGDGTPWLATLLVAIVIFQGLLGMWTVTLLLKPAIVTAHLLGGMATWAILLTLCRQEFTAPRPRSQSSGPTPIGLTALALILGQIALGGWVSSNYAALACPDFPTCRQSWWPEAEYHHAFQIRRELGQTAAGALLPMEALTAIHWTHRLGALAVLLLVAAYAVALARAGRRGAGLAVGLALGGQVALGIANVLMQLPLPLAVAHNLGAALLLGTVAISLL